MLFCERASPGVVVGMGGGTKAATESVKEEETLAAGAVKMAASLWTLFVVWGFCSPHHSTVSSR